MTKTYDAMTQAFQSTHPVRGATCSRHVPASSSKISIHAPREGCDGIALFFCRHVDISIHAPREGCDVFYNTL